ncbi:putative exported protein [Enhygromyxa salina]|uniref:Putative exported protein n=1 Tax=Enhygromyxa salina TaxID=215803 RepID=A0A0C1ZNF1_9BACT|nr:DUF2169 domain-containing protein [Enhygromyxa salina]KIG18999.1 putative exported protein [Enhygromyxa salina]
MHIATNTTPLTVDLSVASDKDGREHCVVVAKASFLAGVEPGLAPEQAPLVYADQLAGQPGSPSTDWETDFAPFKPLTDVIVRGKAIAPGRVPVAKLPVRLEVEGRSKDAWVFGERRWVSVVGFTRMSDPVPFVEMPLSWERASGGPYNPVGVAAGEAVPNIEDPRQAIGAPGDRPPPRGFAWVGRGWQPRVAFAGTYDQRWRTEVCPLLPHDFDQRYFQAAPADQQFPHFRGGEHIRCVHMAAEPIVEWRVPTLPLPIRFDFLGGPILRMGVIDTVVLEPHIGRMHVCWRCSVPLPRRHFELREINVGSAPRPDQPIGQRRGKPLFAGLDSYMRWHQRTQGGP